MQANDGYADSSDCPRRRASLVFNQHGITKLVSAVAARGRERRDATEGCVVSECLQELKVALARLMHARQHRFDNAQPGCATDTSARNPLTGTYRAVGGSR